MAAPRTGSEYLRALNDGRQVFLDGGRVADVSRHKAFREAARSVAKLYDIAAAPENRELMTFKSPKTGEPVLRAFQLPATHADLRQRRLFSEKWAEATFGLMGRTPDHVAGFFTGYASVPEVFALPAIAPKKELKPPVVLDIPAELPKNELLNPVVFD